MQELMIHGNAISTNRDGMFSLNDLHRAAGGEDKDSPRTWIRNSKTEEFILAVKEQGENPIDSSRGRMGGTFVCTELVYHYAMWVSPEFSLKVIRGFHSFSVGDMPTGRAESLAATAAEIEVAITSHRKKLASINAELASMGLKRVDSPLHIAPKRVGEAMILDLMEQNPELPKSELKRLFVERTMNHGVSQAAAKKRFERAIKNFE